MGDNIQHNVATKDTEEAAFLWCQDGVMLEKAEAHQKAHGGVAVFFIFVGSKDIDFSALKKKYFNRLASVEPMFHAQRLKDIRNTLHDALRNARAKNGN